MNLNSNNSGSANSSSTNNGAPVSRLASPAVSPAPSSYVQQQAQQQQGQSQSQYAQPQQSASASMSPLLNRSAASTSAQSAAASSIAPMSSIASARPIAQPRQSQTGGWKEMKTPEGQSYYWNQLTNLTTWEKPEELKTEADRERAGDWIWMPHPVEGFLPARRLSETAVKLVAETEDGRQHTILKKELSAPVEQLKWTQLNQLQRDLVMLDVMSRPLIMYNLKERFKANEIYTNVGNILISINPYKWLPLYTPEKLNEYINKGNRKMPPHVFLIADDAYALLRDTQQGQSIVISGSQERARRSAPSSACSTSRRSPARPATWSSASCWPTPSSRRSATPRR